MSPTPESSSGSTAGLRLASSARLRIFLSSAIPPRMPAVFLSSNDCVSFNSRSSWIRSSKVCVSRFHVGERKSSSLNGQSPKKKRGAASSTPSNGNLQIPKQNGPAPQVTLTRTELYINVIVFASAHSKYFQVRPYAEFNRPLQHATMFPSAALDPGRTCSAASLTVANSWPVSTHTTLRAERALAA